MPKFLPDSCVNLAGRDWRGPKSSRLNPLEISENGSRFMCTWISRGLVLMSILLFYGYRNGHVKPTITTCVQWLCVEFASDIKSKLTRIYVHGWPRFSNSLRHNNLDLGLDAQVGQAGPFLLYFLPLAASKCGGQYSQPQQQFFSRWCQNQIPQVVSVPDLAYSLSDKFLQAVNLQC